MAWKIRDEEEKEEPIEVWLEKSAKNEGAVLLRVKKEGRCNVNILRLEADGEMSLFSGIPGDMGIQLDKSGKIQIKGVS